MEPTLLKKYHSVLQSRPLVAGTLTGSQTSSQLKSARSAKIDLLELRLDTFSFLTKNIEKSVSRSKETLLQIRKTVRLPVLLTLRSYKEAGPSVSSRRKFDDTWRWEILKGLIPFVEAVDVEAQASGLIKKVASLAAKHHVCMIQSHHNFRAVSQLGHLKKIHDQALQRRVDILKVAVMPKTEKDLRSFLKWGLSVKNPKVILIGMGPLGILSRFLGYSFGSILTFGHLGNRLAPGQIHAKDLSASIRDIYE